MSAAQEKWLERLEEEYEDRVARGRKIRLYWIDEHGNSEPAWEEEGDAK
jgi:hypothetical protein